MSNLFLVFGYSRSTPYIGGGLEDVISIENTLDEAKADFDNMKSIYDWLEILEVPSGIVHFINSDGEWDEATIQEYVRLI